MPYYYVERRCVIINSIPDRLKFVRTEVGLTQADFSSRLGMQQSPYSKFERGDRPIPDRYILLVCSQFGVNEHWLRTGEGDMWQEDDDVLLDRMTKKHHLTDRQRAIVQNFLALPEDRREALLDLLSDILPPREAPAPAADVPEEVLHQLDAMDAALDPKKNEESRDA